MSDSKQVVSKIQRMSTRTERMELFKKAKEWKKTGIAQLTDDIRSELLTQDETPPFREN